MENISGKLVAAKIRLLGAPAASVGSGKLSVAWDLARELIDAASSSSKPRAEDPPLAVLTVYCRTLIEWVISSILKLKPSTASASAKGSQKGGSMVASASAAAGAAPYDSNADDPVVQALSLWRLLRLLLESSSSGPMATALAGANVPGSLLPAAAQWLRPMVVAADNGTESTAVQKSAPSTSVAATAVASPPASNGQQFCTAVRSCLRVLLPAAGGGDGLLRPSLEQCLTLLTALLEAQPIPGCTDPASSATAAASARAQAGGAAGTASAAPGEGKRKHKRGNGPPGAPLGSAQGADAAGMAADGSGSEGVLPFSWPLSHTHAASSYADWARLCATAMHATHGSVQGHSVPKKVWQAFVPGLVLRLLRIAQPQDPLQGTLHLVLGAQAAAAANAAAGLGAVGARPAAGAAAAATAELSRAAQQLLGAVLFNEAHVGGMAELFSSLVYGEFEAARESGADTSSPTENDTGANAAGADAADYAGAGHDAKTEPAHRPRVSNGTAAAAATAIRKGAGGAGRATGRGGDADAGEGRKGAGPLLPSFVEVTGRSYHGQLLQVFAAAMDSCGKSGADAAAMIGGLPWFLRGFCRAAAKLRHTLAMEAAAAAAAAGGGGSSQTSKRWHAGGAEGEEAAAGGGKEADAVPSSYKGLAAAEFNCMAALSYMLLQPPPPAAAAAAVRESLSGGGDEVGSHPAKKRKLAAGAAAAAAGAAAVSPAATAGGGVDCGGTVCRLALAGLLAAGRVVGAYQITRDLTGDHGAVLAAIADALMAAPTTGPQSAATRTAAADGDAAYQVSPKKGSKARRRGAGKNMAAAADAASGDVETADSAPYSSLGALSSSLALCAVLDLDHRVLTPHLERLWSLLWATAAGVPSPPLTTPASGAGGDLGGAAPPLETATKASAVGASGGGGAGAMAAAAAVLQRTVRAFSDLRQLQTLLESMGSAMRALCVLAPAAAAAGEGTDGGGGGSDPAGGRVASKAAKAAMGRVAAALLVRPELLGALHQAVSAAPSGQLPALVGWVASDLRAWAVAGVDGGGDRPAAATVAADLLLAAGALYDTLLTALRLDLATAMPVGQSLQGLLTTVAGPLLHAVRSYCEARAAAAAAAAVGGGDTPDGLAGDAGSGGGCSGTGTLLSYLTAHLALLLRMYGAVVRTNAICSGLHPEIAPLPDHEITPRGESQQDGGAASGGRHARGGYLAAAILYGTSSDGGGRIGGADAAADSPKALGRLRKALIRAGCSRYAANPLPALAQLALLPGLTVCALSILPGPAKMGTAEAAAAETPSCGSRRASVDWAAVELSKAVHRCLCHRAQTLHERILRRRHDCPLYGKPPANAGAASGGDGDEERVQGQNSSAAADAAVAAAAADQKAAGAAGKEKGQQEEGQGEEEEEEELRLVVQLILSPFSHTAAAASEAVVRIENRPSDGSASSSGTPSTVASHAAAAATAAAAAAWGDVMGLMGCLGPWADRQALSEVLQLTLRTTCVRAPGGGIFANSTSGPDGLYGRAVGGGSEWRLLRALRPSSSACLRLAEFQGLPGVRHALPYSWIAEAAEALRELAAGVRQVAAVDTLAAATATATAAASADGGGAECLPAMKAKRERCSEPAGGGNAPCRADADDADAAAAADSRLAALLDVLSADVGRDGAGSGGGVSSGIKGTASKALRRLLAGQAEALHRATDGSRPSSYHVVQGADPWVGGCSIGDDGTSRTGTLGDGADGTTAAAAAAATAGRVRSLLEVLYGDLHLDLLSRKARKALLRCVAAAAAALTDMLLLLLPRLLAHPPPEPSIARPEVLSRRRAVLVAWEVSAAAVTCLQAWQRLAAVRLYDSGGKETGDGGAGAGRRRSVSDAAADPWVSWLLPASRLLADLAAVLDCLSVSSYRSGVQDARGHGTSSSWPLSVEVVHVSGRLLGALLPSQPGQDGEDAVPGTIASRMSLATDLLTQAKAQCSAIQSRAGQDPNPKASAARYPGTAAGGASTATAAAGTATAAAAEVALLCRLAVAAVSSAIGVASWEEGRDGSNLTAISALAAQVRGVLMCAVDAAVAEAEAAKADLCAVHLLRALLCLVAIQGQALQRDVKAAATVAATGAQANGGSGSRHRPQHRHGRRPGVHAPAAVPDGRAVLRLLQQASSWVAAERRLAGDVRRGGSSSDTGSSNSGSSSARRNGAGADAATVATEPLEHCLALVYGISAWLPYMRHGGGGTAADHDDGQVSEPGGTGREGAVEADSDTAHSMLVAVHQSLMLCTAAPERCCFSRTTNMWGVLLADLEPTGAGCASRVLLLESFRDTLAHSNRGQLAALLRGLVQPLTHGSADTGQVPAAMLPPLHCLLVCLECLSSPRAIRLLATQGPVLTTALTELLGALAARAGLAAAVDADADAASFYDSGSGGGGGGREAVEAALCCALRCLQSVLAREQTFRLGAPALAAVLSAVATLASCPLLRPQPLLPAAQHDRVDKVCASSAVAIAADGDDGSSRDHSDGCGGRGLALTGSEAAARRRASSQQSGAAAASDLYFLHASCSGLVAAVVRHHEDAVRHCGALVVNAARALLLSLAGWASELRSAQKQLLLVHHQQQSHQQRRAAAARAVAAATDGIARCAGALARVYEAISEHPKTLGKYAVHLLADYIVHVATPLPSLSLILYDNSSGPWTLIGGQEPTVQAARLVWPGLAAEYGNSGDDVNTCAPDGAADRGADDLYIEDLVGSEDGGGGVSAGGAGAGPVGATLLPPAAHHVLRQGAFSLMSCLGQQQLQHLHMALGLPGSGDAAAAVAAGLAGLASASGLGAARRTALMELRKEYNSSYKYTGKV